MAADVDYMIKHALFSKTRENKTRLCEHGAPPSSLPDYVVRAYLNSVINKRRRLISGVCGLSTRKRIRTQSIAGLKTVNSKTPKTPTSVESEPNRTKTVSRFAARGGKKTGEFITGRRTTTDRSYRRTHAVL